ncbi:accessory Sec system glycosyltransferase GtfA [Jeotgalicoccus huakuii]|uniref:accessory Sec system glycosyltransferase GtfA n=1 Tax=Jeotgalicoccus sp. S0W5 TaxID=2527874 RepID=UPI001415270D|nr:accessory Sec system glycosyltransferase GtfA [Jeotgalicoccus sp. S0W5]MCK1977468.1 accessory Sec system glycosyltransferase GtfA [Jeotgalicoccus huakuii]
MTIYNINFGIGWASSGVEYAQVYRAQALRKLKTEFKFIFLDFIGKENIQTLTSNIGFKDDEIIWIYQYFTDIEIAKTSVTIDQVLNSQDIEISHKEVDKDKVKYFYDNNKSYLICYLKDKDEPYVDRVEYISRGKLLRRDYYSYTKILSEYFVPENNTAKLYKRCFFNKNGSIAYREFISNNNSIFVFKDSIFYSKAAFVGYFLKCLSLKDNDILIIDRNAKIGQEIVKNKGDAKVGVVIHAEHYNHTYTTEDYILWNNYYEYVFSNVDLFDFFITATEGQSKVLNNQFKKYYNYSPRIFTIPVGNLKSIKYSEERKPYSIITASRLATEKHVDWLIKAVIEAKKVLPELTFDIYGEGGQKKILNDLIESYHANDYIKLCGHLDLTEIYKYYELFLSGSKSEGFGLTLMEAVGSGLGIIGFNVNYGNPTFINHGSNGYLVDIDFNNSTDQMIIEKLREAIIDYFNDDLEKIHESSYRIAEDFKLSDVINKWQRLTEEVLYD